ncbi:STM4015 family protein [Spirillospora sp. NPDC052242]
MIDEPLGEYAGLPVVTADDPPPAGPAAWKVGTDHDDDFPGEWEKFLRAVDPAEVTALVIGHWGPGSFTYPLPMLLESAGAFSNLRSLFFGDITYDLAEMSWIRHEDISPLFTAFPALERLDVRGSDNLSLDPIVHASLKVLRFESSELHAGIVRAVAAGDLPSLEHLDLWLGRTDASTADLAPVLTGERFPRLRHLGLENGEDQDDLAEALASAPVVARLESLSLAMGALTDRGAEALLLGQPLTHLRKLDLHHHFLSEDMMQRVAAALPGVEVDLGDRQVAEDFRGDPWFYVAVSE